MATSKLPKQPRRPTKASATARKRGTAQNLNTRRGSNYLLNPGAASKPR
jgi:hypothetical protein